MQYRVDKKVCWQTNISEKPLDEFDLVGVEQQLNNAIEIQHEMKQGWRTTSIIVIVKSKTVLYGHALKTHEIAKDTIIQSFSFEHNRLPRILKTSCLNQFFACTGSERKKVSI